MNAALVTTESDLREVAVRFVVQLFDGFTGGTVPAGDLSARLTPELAGKRFRIVRKSPDATFVCIGLPPDDYTLTVTSNTDRVPATAPYYFARSYPFTVPPPPAIPPQLDPAEPLVWPGIPDISLADLDLPLDHPQQRAAFLAQRREATLLPTAAYPFPPDATLVRGTVLNAKNEPLAGAKVEWKDGGQTFLTGADGQFVVFLLDFPKPPQITLRATHHAATATRVIEVRRGTTVAVNLQVP